MIDIFPLQPGKFWEPPNRTFILSLRTPHTKSSTCTTSKGFSFKSAHRNEAVDAVIYAYGWSLVKGTDVHDHPDMTEEDHSVLLFKGRQSLSFVKPVLHNS